MKPTHILLTALLLLILCAAPVAADAVTHNGKTYVNYDQIYASTTLSSSEKLALVQEMAGWSEELAAYIEWKNSGGLEAYQAAVSGNSTSSDYGWDEAPGDGLGDGGTSIEPEYSYQERQAYDAAYAAYQAEFATTNVAAELYALSGAGTASNPYIISSASDFVNFRDTIDTLPNTYWELSNDIDLSGISSLPATGTTIGIHFNGNGYFIKSGTFTISGQVVFGLIVDSLTKNGEIVNVGVKNIALSGPLAGTTNNNPAKSLIAGNVFSGSDIKNIYVEDCSIFYQSLSGNVAFYAGGVLGEVSTYSSSSSDTNIEISNIFIDGLNMGGDVSSSNLYSGFIAGSFYGSGSGASKSVHISDILIVNSNYDNDGVVINMGSLAARASAANSNYKTSVSDMVVLSQALTNTQSTKLFRIGAQDSNSAFSNNYALASFEINGNTVSDGTTTNANGADITTTQATSESFYVNTVGFDFANTWYWDASATWQDATGTTYTGLPKLQIFKKSAPPTISSITATPSIGGQQDTYTLSVSATTEAAGGIASYQWYGRIGSSGEWQAISDGTSATYQFVPGAYALGDFYFKCVVTGADGGVIDSYDTGFTNVKITVVLAPQITSPAATPATGPLSQTVQLSASVTSTETVTYQWQELVSGTWTNISGATSATATVNIADSAATLHSYRLAASNVGGTAYSSTVTYQSVAPPTFSAVSASPSQGTYTSTVQLSATVSGSDSLQWQELVGSSWQNINGATSAVYSLTLTDTAATLHSYRLAATNIGGTAYSSTVTYQSVAPPVFSAFQVSPLSGGVPLSVSFSATASDTSGYRWEYSTDGTIWVQMASGASGSYTFTAEGVYYIRVIAIGTGGSTTSASATVTASVLLPEFTQISASPTSGVAPFAVTLSASATNDATFVWQMQSGSSWVQIGSGSPLTYTIPSGTSAGMVYFRAVATNQYGSTTSQTLAVEVGAAPAAEIASPAPGAVFGSNRLISFAAADAGAGVTYSWNFGDGQTGSGKTVTHSYSETGFFMVTLTTSSQFGSSEDVVRIEIVEATGDIWLAVSDISSTGASVQATVEVSPVDPGTKVWFEVLSESGTVILRSAQLTYSGPVTWEAEGLPMISGETYRVVAKSNYYGYSLPATFTLIDAVQQPHETLGTEWENGLSRDPFNVSLLVSSGIAVFGGSMGGGSVGAAVAFGVIVMFVLVGLWLRQQDVVIPLTLTLVAGWFVIGNLPGEWQPIAYTLMVVAVVAIFFYLFRKRIE